MTIKATITDAEELCNSWLNKPIANYTLPKDWRCWPSFREAHRILANRCIRKLPEVPPKLWTGDGIVIVGGGRYWESTYVTVRMLRHVGCVLPAELWHFAGEITPDQRRIMADLGVECIDEKDYRDQYPRRVFGGWQLKPFAVYHSSFARVLYLDADCYPVRDPSFLFEHPQFLNLGAIFFPDGANYNLPYNAWEAFGLNYSEEAAFESGQLMVDKDKCFQELLLTIHYNDYSDYYYHWESSEAPDRIIYGDKETWHMAWKALGRPYHMMRRWPVVTNHCYLHQGDDREETLFVHRCKNKFRKPTAYFPTPQSGQEKQEDTAFESELPLERTAWGFFEEVCKGTIQTPRYTILTQNHPYKTIDPSQLLATESFNPSILSLKEGGYMMAYRAGNWNGRICLARLDEEFSVMRTAGVPNTWELCWKVGDETSHEDPRLLQLPDDQVLMSYSHYNGHVASVGVVEFRDNWQIKGAYLPELPHRQFWEKNWVFFEWAGQLFCVYSIDPHQILHLVAGKAYRVWRTSVPRKWAHGTCRGGASPVLRADKGEYYHFFHGVTAKNGVRIYNLGVYTFSPYPPFGIKRFCTQPLLSVDPRECKRGEVAAIFPGGAVWKDGVWNVACGWLDRECRIYQIPEDYVEEVLK